MKVSVSYRLFGSINSETFECSSIYESIETISRKDWKKECNVIIFKLLDNYKHLSPSNNNLLGLDKSWIIDLRLF